MEIMDKTQVVINIILCLLFGVYIIPVYIIRENYIAALVFSLYTLSVLFYIDTFRRKPKALPAIYINKKQEIYEKTIVNGQEIYIKKNGGTKK